MSSDFLVPSPPRERRRLSRPGQEGGGPRRDSAGQGELPLETGMFLRLHVTDPEVIEAIEAVDLGDRERFAQLALRIGVLSMSRARGEVDAANLRNEGQRMVEEVGHALSQHAARLNGELTSALRDYLDPSGGKFSQRIERLLARDGELVSVLQRHVGGDDSEIAKTMAAHLGASSPLFRMLDPSQADGLLHRLQELVREQLEGQRKKVLAEFSLDDEGSALRRFMRNLQDENGRLKQEFAEDFGKVLAQFSMDDEQSALFRMVDKIDNAHRSIVQQFSLDHDQSALSRLKSELSTSIETLTRDQRLFQQQVFEQLCEMSGRRQAEAEGVQHGRDFEQDLGLLICEEAHRLGDLFHACGATTGVVPHCKKGDQVVELGPESPCPGACVVFEAKEDRSYDDRKARDELEIARRNRKADVGVFVFSRKTAGDREPFRRLGEDLFVVWDPEDRRTDLYVKAALGVARAMLFERRGLGRGTIDADWGALDRGIADIQKQADRLERIRRSSETIKRSAESIQKEVDGMERVLRKRVAEVENHVAAIREAVAEGV